MPALLGPDSHKVLSRVKLLITSNLYTRLPSHYFLHGVRVSNSPLSVIILRFYFIVLY